MRASTKTLLTRIGVITLTLAFSSPVTGQEKRYIPFPTWAASCQTDEEAQLELVEFKLAGNLSVLGQPLYADEGWLRKITFRVKNVSQHPIAAFAFGGGLLRRVDEELPPHASYYAGVVWKWGKRFDPVRGEKHAGPIWKPGETLELSYAHLDRSHLKVLAREGEGAYHKLTFSTPWIQYQDGKREDAEMRICGNRKL